MYVMPPVFNSGDTVYFPFDTYDSAGASVTITGLAVTDIEVYKNGSITQRSSDNGYTLLDTDGIDFDGSTGLHGFSIDTSDNSDAGFWADGAQYWVHVNAITVDSQTVRFTYFLTLGYLLRPTTAGRKLDVSTGGEAGLDWANVGSPTTTVGLSGTTVKTATDVEADTQDLQARLPAALGANGNMKADVLDLNGNNQSLLDLKDFADDGYNPSVNGIMLVDSVVSTGTVTGNVNGNVGGNVTGSVGSLATQAKADVQAEAEEALQTYHLDHLIASADPGGAVANSSFWAKLHSKSATPAYSSYDNTTDSLEANRDNIGTAGAGLTIAGIAGTITTLDALDTAQDTQHSTSQSKLDTLLSVDRAYAKNVAVTGFQFPMLLTNGDPATGKAASMVIYIIADGVFGTVAATPVEIDDSGTDIGQYKVNLSQAEMNADEISLIFTASGCRQLTWKFRTQA